MTFVDIIDDNNLVEDSTKEMLLKLLECAAEYENVDTEITEMSLSFVSKDEIQEINRDYREKDVPTDVISFALNDEVEDEIDIIGLEEVMNEKGLRKLKGYLEKETKSKWEYFISENSVGSEGYREYYGYIYKKNLVNEVRPLGFYIEKSENEFMREPYGVYFKVKNFDFVFVIAHSIFGDKEKQRVIEASNYINVYEYFIKKSNETDIIIAGDFNLPGNDFGFRNLRLKYNVEPLLDPKIELTTFSDTKLVSSYDNFFINRDYTQEYTGKKGVYNYLKNNNKYMKQYISDHLLIFSEFNINEDKD